MAIDIETLWASDFCGQDEMHELKQLRLKTRAKVLIKDGYNTIPRELDCCFFCKNMDIARQKCSKKEDFEETVSVLHICEEFER
jgi:hypothetical protein